MTTFIATNGQICELTPKIIKSIRRKVIIDLEKINYSNLSENYKRQYTLNSWLSLQVIGRLFMTGDKDNDTWSEFYQKFWSIGLQIAKGIMKDYDDATNVVSEQFNMFRWRKMYCKNAETSDQMKKVEKIKETLKKKFTEVTNEKFDEKKDYDQIVKIEIPELQKLLEKEEEKLKNMIIAESQQEIEKMEKYDGLTYEEIYNLEKEEMENSDTWYRSDAPITGYIIQSIRHLSIMTYNKRKNDRIVIASRLQKNGAAKEDDMSEEEIIGLSSAKNEEDIYNCILNDDFEGKNLGINADDMVNDDSEAMIHHSKEAIIHRAEELCKISGDNSGVLLDFIFGGFSQKEVQERNNLNTVGAVKSRVSRSRMKIREQLFREKETQEIREKLKKDGILTYYYPNMLCCKREVAEVKDGKLNGQNIKYNVDGSIKSIKTYKDGILDGDYIEYHDNNVIKIKGQYKDGKKFGIWKRGSSERVLEEEVLYIDDNNYEFKLYNAYGILEIVGKTVNGKTESKIWNGQYELHYKNGQLKLIGQYKDGKKFGLWKRYSKEGIIEEEVNYKLDGSYSYVFYDENGKIESKGKFSPSGKIIL